MITIFKKKKPPEKKPTDIKKEQSVDVKSQQPQKIKDYNPRTGPPSSREGLASRPATLPKGVPKKFGEAYRILKTPHVTEKSTDLVKKNQYVFKVWPRSNKVEIKKAIGNLYGVDVISVKIIKIPRKRRRLGKIRGFRRGYKKAIVKIKEGQKIEVLLR